MWDFWTGGGVASQRLLEQRVLIPAASVAVRRLNGACGDLGVYGTIFLLWLSARSM